MARCTAPITCASDGQRHWSAPSPWRRPASRPCPPAALVGPGAPAPSSRPARRRAVRSPTFASATSGSARCLPASKGCTLRPMMLLARILEQRPRAGGEILQARADGQHDIGLLGQRVGGRGAGDADRAHVERMIVRQRRFAGLRLARPECRRLGEFRQCVRGFGIEHAAAGDDERLLRALERRDRGGKFVAVGRGRRGCQTRSAKKLSGIIDRPRPARPGRSASVTGPQSAGSVSTAMARLQCAG